MRIPASNRSVVDQGSLRNDNKTGRRLAVIGCDSKYFSKLSEQTKYLDLCCQKEASAGAFNATW